MELTEETVILGGPVAGAQAGTLSQGAVALQAGRVAWVGARADLPSAYRGYRGSVGT